MSLTKTAPKARKKTQAAAAARAPELIFGDLWEFDPAPESADPKIKQQYELFIGGKFHGITCPTTPSGSVGRAGIAYSILSAQPAW